MTKERFAALMAHAGPIAPEGVEEYVADLEPRGGGLLTPETLEGVLADNHVPEEKCRLLWEALREIEEDEELVALSQVLCQDAVRSFNRGTACDFQQPRPDCLRGFAREAYAFLYVLSCMEEGRRVLRARGVPESCDADIPERMLRKQLAQYVEKDDISFDDYHWDINFYCCAIFLLDRFYFIPCRHWGPECWRRARDGRVVALWPAGRMIRRDGQLNGVNGVNDPAAIKTVREETTEYVTANPVNPAGLVSLEPVTLDKREWRRVLVNGDGLLALHIPGGEGYTPERVRHSMELALAFYDRYFPEVPVRGFWSESWLYDPGLAALLAPDSRILRVQRQLYCYPTMEGDSMARKEVFGDSEADLSRFEPRTRLQRGMLAALRDGTRFHTTGMLVLREEVPQIGREPYRYGR